MNGDDYDFGMFVFAPEAKMTLAEKACWDVVYNDDNTLTITRASHISDEDTCYEEYWDGVWGFDFRGA